MTAQTIVSGMQVDGSTIQLGANNTFNINPINSVNRLQALSVVAANSSMTLPANAMILDIIVQNTTANAITGGLKIGTTAGATDIMTALAVGANAFTRGGASILKTIFSPSATQQIFIDTVTLWNSANVNITIVYVVLS